MKILNFLKGYKTFVIGFAAIVWGIHTQDANTIIIGSGFIGLRQSFFSLESQIVPILLNYFSQQNVAQTNVSAPVPAVNIMGGSSGAASTSVPSNDPKSL